MTRKRTEPKEQYVLNRLKSLIGSRGSAKTKLPFRVTGVNVPVGEGLGRGIIDAVVWWRGGRWAIEAKGHGGGSSFWDAAKVLAYVKVYNRINGQELSPAILLPLSEICVGTYTYATLAGVAVFSWDEEDGVLIIREHCLARYNK